MSQQKSDSLDEHTFGQNNYQYTAATIDDLTAPEYTLVQLIVDESGSTFSFRPELTDCIRNIVMACRQSPRADYLLLRIVAFSTKDREVHGYKLLDTCDLASYTNIFTQNGSTLLFDSVVKGVQSLGDYARQLRGSEYGVNGIVIVLTDGEDTHSSTNAKDVGAALVDCIAKEALESLVSILVGVNTATPHMAKYLKDFADDAKFTRYVNLENADSDTMAKLADFVSKSISSQSQAIGSGGPSQAIASLTI